MRIQLVLTPVAESSVIPLNYQYELSSWIYKVIAKSDTKYATFLHEKGYQSGIKTFKFFTFSNLEVPKKDIQGDRMVILSDVIRLKISFYLDQAAEEFIVGLFQGEQMDLADRKSKATFLVQQVLTDSLEISETTIRIRTNSPLVIGRKNVKGHDDYVSPEDPDFGRLLFENLQDKFLAAHPERQLPAGPMAFRFLQYHRIPNKLITIKAGTPEETRIRGYLFDFELTAPKAILQLGLLAGFGKFNSLGFGSATQIR